MQKAFKFRLYPTDAQKEFLSKQFGAVRFVYNRFLANRKDKYLNNLNLCGIGMLSHIKQKLAEALALAGS